MFSIYPSQVIEYLFCPRFTYFEYVLRIPQYEEKYYKVMKGREVHDEKLNQNKDYLRQRIGVINKYLNQYLCNEYLRGQVDEVLELKDGTMAPLDYKYAEYKERIFNTYKTQLVCYAVLIEDNFHKKVNKGYLVYIRSNNKIIEVGISDSDKIEMKEYANSIIHIIDRNFYPKGTKDKLKCIDCTYKNICTK
ncbi:MAG: CRISPR-associated protein Cas4 [Ignavibacteriae bacterium]|nr:CRISPR-associated protein Cas4 [Ignavibacteriota bacterium]